MKFMRKNGGFTLVELIVVIAILAILAGVAVPAYTGYIAKADTAADLQLLSAANTAFSSACALNGEDHRGRADASAAITNGVFAYNGPFAEDFAAFYADSANSTFKVITRVAYDSALGMFVDPATASSITVNYKGSNIVLSGKTLQGLSNSTFGTIGSDALLDQIGTVTGAAAIMADSLDAVFKSESFQAAAWAAVGATTKDEYDQKAYEIVQQMVAKGMTEEAAMDQLKANAAVLYASQNAMGYTEQQITDLFAGGSDAVKNNLKGADTANGMAQAALVYGMYTAYANSEYGSSAAKENANNPLNVLDAMDNDENFKKYLSSEQGKTDLAAYQDALGVIVDSTNNNEKATTDLLLNGFDNAELKGIMSGLIG